MESQFNFAAFLIVIAAIALVICLFGLFWYVYEMACRNGRSSFYWIVLSLLLTPITTIILLACIGETDEKRRERLWLDEDYLKGMRE